MSSKLHVPALLCLLLNACAATEPGAPAQIAQTDQAGPVPLTVERPAMAGDWEKNYGRSDDFNTRFSLFLADVQRGVVRRGQIQEIGINSYTSREALLGLARFTEEITRLPDLHIDQDGRQIIIERSDDFPLECHLEAGVDIDQGVFGSQRCGWNGNDQLRFDLVIGDDLIINHAFTLGPDGQELSVVTTVESAEVGTPLTVINYYRRSEAPAVDYDCMLTLTRNTVCSQYGQ